jgi:integrase
MSELYKYRKSPFYHYTLVVNGVRVRRSTKQRVKHLAQQVLRAAELKALSHGIESLTRKAPTLTEFIPTFEAWVKDHQTLKASTKRFYQCGANMLKVSKLAPLKLTAITADEIVTTPFPGGNYNANKALRTLRSILTRAEDKGLFPGKLPKVKTRKTERRTLCMTLAQAKLIADKIEGDDPRDVFLLLTGTGMRPSEAMSARWESVDWRQSRYLVPHGKTEDSTRPVPLLGDSRIVLERRHLVQGQPTAGWIFPAESEAGHTVTIKAAYNAARDAAGLPAKMVPYTARHAFLTRLAAVASTAEVMRFGGHSSAQIAMLYQHPETNTAELQSRLNEAETAGRIQ